MNKAPVRHHLVDAIKSEGVEAHVDRILRTVKAKLEWHRQQLAETTASDWTQEQYEHMYREELDRARRAYGLAARVSSKTRP